MDEAGTPENKFYSLGPEIKAFDIQWWNLVKLYQNPCPGGLLKWLDSTAAPQDCTPPRHLFLCSLDINQLPFLTDYNPTFPGLAVAFACIDHAVYETVYTE